MRWSWVGLALALGVAACENPVPEPPPVNVAPEARLLRHVTIAEMRDLAAGRMTVDDFGPFDIFEYGHIGKDQQMVDMLVYEEDRECWRYVNVLTFPITEWVGGGSPWLDYMHFTVKHEWGAVVVSNEAPADTAVFKWWYQPHFVNWCLIDSTRAREFVDEMYRVTPTCGSWFWDQFWTKHSSWMCDPERGPVRQLNVDPQTWRTNILWALEYARSRRETIVNAIAALPDSDLAVLQPQYIENADWHWAESMAVWHRPDKHRSSTLAVKVQTGRFIDSVLVQWLGHGGVAAFDKGRFGGVEATRREMEAMYQRAYDTRAAR